MNLAQNNNIVWYWDWDWDGTKNLKMSYNYMDLVILEKIEFCILNGLGYIGRLEKKNGNKNT